MYLRAGTQVNIVSRKKKNFAECCSVRSATSSQCIKDNELNLLLLYVLCVCVYNSYIYIWFYLFFLKIPEMKFPLQLFQTSLVAITDKCCVGFG